MRVWEVEVAQAVREMLEVHDCDRLGEVPAHGIDVTGGVETP